jgi:dTDP-4-dehydrorhamnose reductase
LYVETDKPSPVNKYGLSKLRGEEFLLAKNTDALVFRTSWLYGDGVNNFLYKLEQ